MMSMALMEKLLAFGGNDDGAANRYRHAKVELRNTGGARALRSQKYVFVSSPLWAMARQTGRGSFAAQRKLS